MNLFSVNIGQAQTLNLGGRDNNTAIFKAPTTGPVAVTELGLAGDEQASKRHHGGPDQAVYLYSLEDYAYFSEALGRTLAPGTFGENLTLPHYATATLYIGDRFRVGTVLLEVTAPRIPCATLAARTGAPSFVKRFRSAERPGAYTRVLKTGTLQVGDPVQYERGASNVTLLEVFRLHYDKQPDPAALRHVLSAPLAIRTRRDYERSLAKAERVGGAKS